MANSLIGARADAMAREERRWVLTESSRIS